MLIKINEHTRILVLLWFSLIIGNWYIKSVIVSFHLTVYSEIVSFHLYSHSKILFCLLKSIENVKIPTFVWFNYWKSICHLNIGMYSKRISSITSKLLKFMNISKDYYWEIWLEQTYMLFSLQAYLFYLKWWKESKNRISL